MSPSMSRTLKPVDIPALNLAAGVPDVERDAAIFGHLHFSLFAIDATVFNPPAEPYAPACTPTKICHSSHGAMHLVDACIADGSVLVQVVRVIAADLYRRRPRAIRQRHGSCGAAVSEHSTKFSRATRSRVR